MDGDELFNYFKNGIQVLMVLSRKRMNENPLIHTFWDTLYKL